MTEKDSTLNEVSARPTKNFFVGMFTRDIELQDAILDLLDNCVDGIQRALYWNLQIGGTLYGEAIIHNLVY